MRRLAWLLVLAAPAIAHADDEVRTCVDAHEKGQLLRKDGKWLEARREFLVCANDACPSPVKDDCAPWLEELAAHQPSVLVVARDEMGRDLADVKVTVDGQPVATSVGAVAIPIDPGAHTMRFEHAGSTPVEQTLLLRDGEQNRRVEVRFAAPPPVTPRPLPPRVVRAPGPSLAPAFVLAGVATTSLLAFGGLAIAGKVFEGQAATQCAPQCTSANSAYSTMYASYYTADVFLAVGIATAVASAVVFLVTHPRRSNRAFVPRALFTF